MFSVIEAHAHCLTPVTMCAGSSDVNHNKWQVQRGAICRVSQEVLLSKQGRWDSIVLDIIVPARHSAHGAVIGENTININIIQMDGLIRPEAFYLEDN